MKPQHFSSVALAAMAVLAISVSATAQLAPTNSPSADASPGQACGHWHDQHGKWSGEHQGHWRGHHHGCNGWGRLTPEERTQLKADWQKIHGNAQIVAARNTLQNDVKTLRLTQRELLLKADPSLKPVLDKIAHEERWAHLRGWFNRVIHFGHQSKMDGHQGHHIWAKLTPAERTQLKAGFQKIHGDAQLVAAHQAVWNQKKALRQLKHDLLLNVDPSIKPILSKIEKCDNHGWHHHGWKGKDQK